MSASPARTIPPRARSVPQPVGLVGPTLALLNREVTRFRRQRARVIGTLLTPVVFWFMIGFGADRAFVEAPAQAATDSTATATANSVGYLEYFFPGILGMVVLFTAIFSTITVIDDRREGFLRSVWISPAPRLAIVLGKALAGAILAAVQVAILLVLWPITGEGLSLWAMLLTPLVAGLVGLGLTALSLTLAWSMRSAAAFHAVMNVLLLPLWMLSGAVFPVHSAPDVMRWAIHLNPVAYGQAALAWAVRGESAVTLAVSGPTALLIAAGCSVVALVWAASVISRSLSGQAGSAASNDGVDAPST